MQWVPCVETTTKSQVKAEVPLEAMAVQPVHAIPSSGTGHKIQPLCRGLLPGWNWLNSQALEQGKEVFLLQSQGGFQGGCKNWRD